MIGVQLGELLDAPLPGVDEALDLVAGFDDALVHGFARLGEDRAMALSALAGALAATPLGVRAGEAAEKIIAGSATDEHLTTLAGGRTALFGAVHDALLTRLDTALGRTRVAWEESPSTTAPSADNLLSGCRSWLNELAITGWRGVGHDLVSAADQTIEALLAVPDLRRQAVLLDGLAAELRASSPVGTMDRLPARRWADLWTRALLLSRPGGGHSGSEPSGSVSGRLLILGVDVHEHGTAVQIQVHGILESAGTPPRLVRASVAAPKVDTIVGPALWRLLHRYPVLLGALAEQRSLDITDMPLLNSGDLVWHDDRAGAGEPADPFATARVLLAGALAPAVPPLDRHPVRISEPVLVEGYTTATEGGAVTLDLGGHILAVDVDRLPTCGPLTPELVAASTACLGLIRWDGGWTLQPLAVQATVKRKPVTAHNGDWALGPTDPKVVKAEAKAGDAVAVLRERAGRLLRR
ncbi:hypothetical protein [Microtetraspora glauca]|uniref:Uncharacterized protein n=1 Tax=Microtetraspora glauca TaxID=1996 RepID=A0ABV3GQE8_MICGL